MKTITTITIAVLSGVICLSSQVLGVLPPTAKLLPGNTLVMVDIESMDRFYANLQKTQMYALYKDPTMAKFIAKIKKGLEEKLAEESPELSKLILEDKIRPSGRVAFALVAGDKNSPSQSEFGYLVLSEWGQSVQRIRSIMEKDTTQATADGAGRIRKTFRGVEMTVLINEQDDDVMNSEEDKESTADTDASSANDKTVYCFIDDLFVVGNDESVIEGFIAALKGSESPKLSQLADYESAMKNVDSAGDIRVYIQLGRIIDKMTEDQSQEDSSILAALGLKCFRGLAASASFSLKNNRECRYQAFLQTDSPRKGLAKLFEMESTSFSIPAFLDTSADRAMFLNFDISAASRELFAMLSQINPMWAASMTAPVVAPTESGQAGITIKDDILAQLGGPVCITEGYKSVSDEPFLNSSMLVCIPIKDRDRLSNAFARIHSTLIAPGKPDSRRDFLGQTLYVFPFGIEAESDEQESDETEAAPAAAPIPGLNSIAVSITSTHFLAGTQDAVEQAIRRMQDKDEQRLESQEWFRKARAAIPVSAGMMSLTHTQAYMKYLWKTIKSEAFMSGIFWTITGEDEDPLAKMIDVSLLPEFSDVQKYFGVSAEYFQTRLDGFYLASDYIIDSSKTE